MDRYDIKLDHVRRRQRRVVPPSVGHAFVGLLCALAVTDVGAQYEVEIKSFSPSVGWAATANEPNSGTLVKLEGKNFDPVSTNNTVLFSGAPGAPPVEASVKGTNPSGSNYAYDTAFGSPGGALGELNGVGPIAIDPDNGNRYVVNIFNRRIEVFDKTGKPVRQLGAASVHTPRGIAVDKQGNVYVSGEFKTPAVEGVGVFDKKANFALKRIIGKGVIKRAGDVGIDDRGYLYVLDYRTGPSVPKLFLFDAAGQVELSFSDPFWGSHLRIAVDPSIGPKSASHVFYISDRHNKAVYKYDTFVPLLDKWKFPGASTVGRVVVDWEGTVYVDLGDSGIVKLDKSGNPAATVIPSPNLSNPPLRTIDKDKRIYVTDTFGSNACECIKVHTLPQNSEIWVRVPAGAKTGPITVKRRYSWGQQESAKSADSFFVLESLPTLSVAKVEPTQGLGSYPFITNKDTLVWAKVNGIFGHPVRDSAKLQVTTPASKIFEQDADHYTYDYDKKKTYIHYHLPADKVDMAGKYSFNVTVARSPHWKRTFSDSKSFVDRKGLNLLVVKYTDVQNHLWGSQDPFPWFDTRTFLYGIDTLSRTFPVPTNGINVHFATAQYKNYIPGGVTDSELGQIGSDVKNLADLFKKNSLFKPDHAIGILDWDLNQTKEMVFGINYGSDPYKIVTFFSATKPGKYYDYGGLLAHEVGHSYGLVKKGKPNYDKAKDDRHSINRRLDKEQGAPITAWSALIDELWPGDQVYTMMAAGPGLDDYVYFESRTNKGVKLDYYDIFDALDKTKVALKTEALSSLAKGVMAQTGTLVISGSIDEAHIAKIDVSYLTTDDLATTPVEISDYSLVFVNDRGEVLSQGGFALSTPFYARADKNVKSGVFDLARVFPEGAARVEIRYVDEVLATLHRSANPPRVQDVRVEVSELAPVSITWAGFDEDGDSLTYSVLYSSDGGETYTPVASGLTGTEFLWDDRLSEGSANALIRVVANDGIHEAEAVSAAFSLRGKKPLVEILLPTDGKTYTQGQIIQLRGAAFDAEDGTLSGAQLQWVLDDSVMLATGRTGSLQNLTQRAPLGPVLSPLAVGTHTIRLVGRDSDENEQTAQATIEVVPDTDRDGVSDADERKAGRDAYAPFDVPPTFRYAVKVICGESDEEVVSKGTYFTVINVHNPTRIRVRVKKKLTTVTSRGRDSSVSEFREFYLNKNQTLAIDCREISRDVSAPRPRFVDGFIILESPAELDVVSVYTAGKTSGHVETLHTERVEPERTDGCADLIVEYIEKPIWEAANERSVIRASLRNVGDRSAGSSMTRLWDLNAPRHGNGKFTAASSLHPLAAGEAKVVTFNLPYWVYSPAAKLEVQADYEQTITECDEHNNAVVFEDPG